MSPPWVSSASGHASDNGSRYQLVAAAALALLGALLRMLAVPPVVGDVDSVNFARSLVAFDPTQQAPHFPGYPVFVLVARAFRETGILSDVWALSLGAIVLWPVAGLILFVGLRRLFGAWPAFGALLTASVAPAAVVAGGWPASDGLGLALLCAGVGALALGSPGKEMSGSRGWAIVGGLLLGLTLGVRLSWCPAVATVLVVFAGLGRASALGDWHQHRHRAQRAFAVVLTATALGVLAWLAPLAALVGPARLLNLGVGFVGGHFSSWGGTAFGGGLVEKATETAATTALFPRIARAAWAVWAPGLGAAWPFGVPMSERVASLSGVGLLLAVLVIVAAIGLVRAVGKGGSKRWVWLLLVVAPYLVWVVGFQNVAKSRHLVPLLPVVGALLFIGLRAWPQRRALAVAFAGLLALVTATRASVQGSEPVPAVAMVHWALHELSQAHPPKPVQIFAGEEARVFEHFAPSLRVLRPGAGGRRDLQVGEILAAEAERVAALGIEVWVSSATPGVATIARHLTPMAHFGFPMQVRAHDSQLTLYRFTAGVRRSPGLRPEPGAELSMNGAFR